MGPEIMASSFSVEDIRLLEKTISIRERLIDNLLKAESLPTKARDIDSFTNLLESVDRSIFSKAKISIDEAANKVNEETKEVLKDLLIDLHKNNSTYHLGEHSSGNSPSFESSGIDVNEGELIHKLDHQDVNRFLETNAE